MSEFLKVELNQSATLGAVVDVVTRISTLSEAKILEMVSARKILDLFPFKPTAAEIPHETVEERELIEASAMPSTREHRAALIQSSMPASPNHSLKRKQSYSEG